MFVFPGDEENQPDAGANRAVGDVEGGKSNFAAATLLNIKINEIHDGVTAWQKPVGQISRDAAENESERNLS